MTVAPAKAGAHFTDMDPAFAGGTQKDLQYG